MARRRAITETKLQIAEVEPFRRYAYDDLFFTSGRTVLAGDRLPFETTKIDGEPVDTTDMMYVIRERP